MAVRIIPRTVRGRLLYQISNVLLSAFAQTAGARSDAIAYRVDITDIGGAQ